MNIRDLPNDDYHTMTVGAKQNTSITGTNKHSSRTIDEQQQPQPSDATDNVLLDQVQRKQQANLQIRARMKKIVHSRD